MNIGEKQIIVSEDDIDGLNHVNNSVYLNYLEHGREAWYIKYAGYSYDDFHKDNLGTVVLRIDILYKREALLHDKLQVITKPLKLGNTSFVFEQEINGEKHTSTFVRTDEYEIETYNGKTDTASIRWVNDCEYILQKLHPKNMAEKNVPSSDGTFGLNFIPKASLWGV